MTRRTMMVGDVVLCAVWLALAIISGLQHWDLGWTVFFGFAAGERYGTVWRR